ncbi:MAG: FtsQ-type POTRA domain-containing protein [Clostridiales bacterium]|nr:FtsQ-type POTRA domain-containing protein [Clostridiales bacterium]
MSFKQKFIIIILISAFIILAAAALVSPVFEIQEIQVVGNSKLSNDDVFELGEIDGIGQNIFIFNSGAVKNKLTASNYIKSVKITKKLPSTVVINIEERRVRGYVPYMGSYLYIDIDGRVIDVKADMEAQHPVVLGLKFDGFSLGEILTVTNGYSLSYVVQISKLIDAYDLSDITVKLDVSDPDDIHLYVKNIDVIFGNIDDAYTKVATLNEILKQLDPEEAGTLDISDINNNPRFKLLT